METSSRSAMSLHPQLQVLAEIRGGYSISEAVSTCATSENRDSIALATALLVMLSFESTVKALVAGNVVSTVTGRKMLHILCGELLWALPPCASPHDIAITTTTATTTATTATPLYAITFATY